MKPFVMAMALLCLPFQTSAACDPSRDGVAAGLFSIFSGCYEENAQREEAELADLERANAVLREHNNRLRFEIDDVEQQLARMHAKLLLVRQQAESLRTLLKETHQLAVNDRAIRLSLSNELKSLSQQLRALASQAQNADKNNPRYPALLDASKEARSISERLWNTALDILLPDITDLIPARKAVKVALKVLDVLIAIYDNWIALAPRLTAQHAKFTRHEVYRKP